MYFMGWVFDQTKPYFRICEASKLIGLRNVKLQYLNVKSFLFYLQNVKYSSNDSRYAVKLDPGLSLFKYLKKSHVVLTTELHTQFKD